jgi:hypothetical protein
MATTEQNGLDARTGAGPGTGHAYTQHGVETGQIDREIGVKGIVWSGVALVVIALVVHFLIWGLLRGFDKIDDRRDVPLTPIEASSPQPAQFPGPNLQTDEPKDLKTMHDEEDRILSQAGWVNRQQGVVRVPVDVAIDVIARRGVAPLGAPPAAPAPAPGAAAGMAMTPQPGATQR